VNLIFLKKNELQSGIKIKKNYLCRVFGEQLC